MHRSSDSERGLTVRFSGIKLGKEHARITPASSKNSAGSGTIGRYPAGVASARGGKRERSQLSPDKDLFDIITAEKSESVQGTTPAQ